MATFLFDQIIFGPVQSRRLGTSLGVNLLPKNRKLCSFECVYCECGWTKKEDKGKIPSRKEVKENLLVKLKEMSAENHLPDVITFAGNGEPTLHPEFAEIINDTIDLRNNYAPNCKIAVLSNATTIHKDSVFNALLKIEDSILKLDSAIKKTVQIMDAPIGNYSIEETINKLAEFNSKIIIQTMFLRGEINGQTFDNTSQEEVNAIINALKRIKPKQVMIYSISRDTPAKNLVKISIEEMNAIAKKMQAIGLKVSVS